MSHFKERVENCLKNPPSVGDKVMRNNLRSRAELDTARIFINYFISPGLEDGTGSLFLSRRNKGINTGNFKAAEEGKRNLANPQLPSEEGKFSFFLLGAAGRRGGNRSLQKYPDKTFTRSRVQA